MNDRIRAGLRPRLAGRGALPVLVALALASGAIPASGQDQSKVGPSGDAAVATLQALCLAGDSSPESVLARADAAGWRRERPKDATSWDVARNRSLKAGPTMLFVDAWSITDSQGHEDSCSIGVQAPTVGWVDAARRWAGVSPDMVLGPSAVFHLVRTDGGWRAATPADQPPTSQATTSGAHYNLMVSDGALEHGEQAPAILMVNHFRAP